MCYFHSKMFLLIHKTNNAVEGQARRGHRRAGRPVNGQSPHQGRDRIRRPSPRTAAHPPSPGQRPAPLIPLFLNLTSTRGSQCAVSRSGQLVTLVIFFDYSNGVWTKKNCYFHFWPNLFHKRTNHRSGSSMKWPVPRTTVGKFW